MFNSIAANHSNSVAWLYIHTHTVVYVRKMITLVLIIWIKIQKFIRISTLILVPIKNPNFICTCIFDKVLCLCVTILYIVSFYLESVFLFLFLFIFCCFLVIVRLMICVPTVTTLLSAKPRQKEQTKDKRENQCKTTGCTQRTHYEL